MHACDVVEQQVIDQEVPPGIYEHYKGGRYEVIGVARFTEDPHQEFVVYKMLYESKLEPGDTLLPAGTLWVRSKKMFTESFVDAKGNLVKRFRKIS
jgi:hypothetical protein